MIRFCHDNILFILFSQICFSSHSAVNLNLNHPKGDEGETHSPLEKVPPAQFFLVLAAVKS
jgi:hypothetical protein